MSIVKLSRLARKIRGDEKGFVAVFVAFAAVALFGLIAISVEVGSVLEKREAMQKSADAAAFSGAVTLLKTPMQNVQNYAKAVAVSNLPSMDSSGATVTVNCNDATALGKSPPYCAGNTTTWPTSDTNAVEVIINKPWQMKLVRFTGFSGLFNVKATAVATKSVTDYCLLALNPNGVSITVKGTVDVGNPNCGVAANSTSSPSTDFKGSGTFNGSLSLSGTMNTNGNNLAFNAGYSENAAAVTDPYEANGSKYWLTTVVATDSNYTRTADCTCSGKKCPTPPGDLNAQPATAQVYCKVGGGATFNGTSGSPPGPYDVYYVDQVTSGVTTNKAALVVRSQVNMSGNDTIDLTAPTTGGTGTSSSCSGVCNKGLALVSPNNPSLTNVFQFNLGGNNTMKLRGAIYAPYGSGTLIGNVDSKCGQIILGSFDLRGTTKLSDEDTSCGISNITAPNAINLVQ